MRGEGREAWPWRLLVWALVAAYLAAIGSWAFSTGVRLRDDVWASTRSVHFQTDIGNAFRWGDRVLRAAEQLANSPAAKLRNPATAGMTARAVPTPGAVDQRPLTLSELLRGQDQVYKDLVVGSPEDSDYQLDYSPLRLLVNTLWTRHIEASIAGLRTWPGAWSLQYSANGDPLALATEDVGRPMLMLNTIAAGAAALFSFVLVWIWANRGGRPALPSSPSGWRAWFVRRPLVPWKPTPLRNAHGLLLFPVCAAAFFYCVPIAEIPAPPPPPAVCFVGRPALTRSAGSAGASAVISANVDGQGADGQWRVDWGTTLFYGRHTAFESADGDVSATLTDLPPGATIHYRLAASNANGVTFTDDATFNTNDLVAPAPPRGYFGRVWLSWEQWAGIGVLLLMMLGSYQILPPIHRGWAGGLIAALLLWFDPSILVDAHIYPQWDVWLVTTFLLAALLTTLDWWFAAGIVLAAGAMLKGQILLGGPILLLWPLLAGRWMSAVRLAVGFLLTFGLVVSPWLALDNQPPDWTVGALRWICAIFAATVIAAAISLYRRPLLRQVIAMWHEMKNRAVPADAPATSRFDLSFFCVSLLLSIILVTVLILQRWPADLDAPSRKLGLLLLLGILLPPWFVRRRDLPIWMAAILTASIWMSGWIYHGDWSWKTIGYDYGTRKHMLMGSGADSIGSLPRILETRFGWDIHDDALTLHPPDVPWLRDFGLNGAKVTLDIRQLLMCVFSGLMVLAGTGAAIQSRRNHPRWLAAMASVWMLMPNVLCQMTGRYHMWSAAMSCLLIAVSPGLTLLHVVVSILAAGMIAGQLLARDPSRSPAILDLTTKFGPDDGLITLTVALVVLYVALAPGKRPNREELSLI